MNEGSERERDILKEIFKESFNYGYITEILILLRYSYFTLDR